MLLCRICAKIATVFTWRTAFGGVQLRRSTAVGDAQSVGKYDWRAPNRLLVVTGVSASQAKVFKARAVPHDLRENLINALKLFANRQKNGDSPIQSIFTSLCERSRKGVKLWRA